LKDKIIEGLKRKSLQVTKNLVSDYPSLGASQNVAQLGELCYFGS